MENQSAVSFHDEYATGDHEFDFFQASHGLPLSAGSMPLQFQGSSQFQGVTAVSAPHLFRNSLATVHSAQSQESHHGFLPLQQLHANLAQSQQAFDASRVLPSRPGQQATALKKPEDPDAACRPRLTPEQTQFLEEIFSHTPRPTTQQKKRHAIELGLTHEKVNNWFQNRRAKSKQMNRIRKELSIMTPDDIPLSQWNDNLSAYQTHGLASPLQLTEEHQAILSMLSQDQSSSGQASLGTTWNNQSSGSVSSASYSSHDELAAAMNQGISIVSGAMGGNLAPQATHDFSPLGEGLGEAAPDWTFNTNVMNTDGSLAGHQDAVDMSQILLSTQASHNSPKLWDRTSAKISADGTILTKLESDTSPTPASALQSQANSEIVSQHTTPQRSPSPKHQLSRPQPPSSDSFIRRDSSASDLANGINTFHLQKLTAQNGTDEEIFKTPKVPSLSLAARRKRERPAALQPLRTVSASNANEPLSSSNSTAMPPSAVRRIKSAGNSLNAFSRVQKSGASSAQRSPLSQTFRDAGVLERLHSQMSDMNGGDLSSNQSQYCSSSPEAHITQWATSPADSFGAAPPLSTSYTSNSYEEPTWAISPPVTPLYKQGFYGHSFAEVPQSAPAHITAFSNLSPPSNHPATSSAYFTPQYHQDPSFFAPVPMSAALHSQNHILKSYDAEMTQGSTRIMRPESGGASGSGCYGLFSAIGAAQPVKEQKELEVILVPFPTPEQRPRSLPRQGANGGVWSFQNTGPKDYAGGD